jgi:hypothetical protein
MNYPVNVKGFYSEKGKEIYIIFGAGDIGEECQYFLWKNNIEVSFFVELNPNLKFKQKKDKLIFSPDILGQLPVEKTFVFLVTESANILTQYTQTLEAKGFTQQDYCHINRKFMSIINKMQSTTTETLNFAKQFMLNKVPLFRLLEIELINRCNGKCAFCPVNSKIDPRPYAKMSDELFYSIIAQLKELDYAGRISLHSNSEPLLDERLVQFAHHIHQELPLATSVTLTNGTLLTLEIFKELIQYLDLLCINNYSNDYEFHSASKQVYEYCLEHPHLAKKVRIQKRLDNEVLHSRGGVSPNAGKSEVFGHVCSYPFSQMIIRPDGKLSFCCADAYAQMTLGDLTKQSILEVWNSDAYAKVRELAMKGSEFVPLCRVCNNSAPLLPTPDPNNKECNNDALVNIGKEL